MQCKRGEEEVSSRRREGGEDEINKKFKANGVGREAREWTDGRSSG